MKWSQELYTTAFKYATDAHGMQKVPGTEIPYIFHISLVCMEVIAAVTNNDRIDQNLAIQCALLHDTIEDTESNFEDIQKNFGPQVAQGVMALTKDRSLPKADQIADSLKRILEQPVEIWIVKMADRVVNLNEPPDFWDKAKKKKYREDAFRIYESLKNGNSSISERLKFKIDNYQKYIN